MPPTVVDNKPEANVREAEWLLPKAEVLAQLVDHDH